MRQTGPTIWNSGSRSAELSDRGELGLVGTLGIEHNGVSVKIRERKPSLLTKIKRFFADFKIELDAEMRRLEQEQESRQRSSPR